MSDMNKAANLQNSLCSGGIIKNDKSPFCKMKSISLGSSRWSSGFWAERFNQCKEVTLPHQFELLDDPEIGHALSNLRIAAGLEEGEFSGTHWQDEWVYKWLEAAAYIYNITKDKALDRRMDEIISIIEKAQQSDGYIATQITVRNWQRFQDINHHELYVMGHLITAACIHYRATGKENFLNIAKKVSDYIYITFISRNPLLAHFCFNPSHIMALVELYRTTGIKKYLELAIVFIDMRGSQAGGKDQNQDRVPLREEKIVVGHSVLSTYLFCGAADAYMETGEQALLDALGRLWKDLVETKMYVHGGICALHKGHSSRYSKESGVNKYMDDVHEAVGMPYELPNGSAYNETCAQIGNMMWNWRMLNISGQAKYTDIMELSLYNSILSGIDLEGKNWFYTNPLRWHGKEHYLLSHDDYQRFKPGRIHICCPSNMIRTIAGLHNYAYSVSDAGFWVHLYGSNTYQGELSDGSRISISQRTDYPWDGNISITTEEIPSGMFSLMLYIPGWARDASIKINGHEQSAQLMPGTYAELKRIWSKGDVVELSLPMEVRLVEGNPKVESSLNQVAVMRGPVVYCLESIDLPEGIKISDVYIPSDIKLTPRYDKEFLNGVVLLEGDALVRKQDDWSGKLYRDFDRKGLDKVNLRLIPYYAWCNRGVGEMTVWMPLVIRDLLNV